MPYPEGESELDGGPLSSLSEVYLATNPHGMFAAVHLEGDLDLPALAEAIRRAYRDFPALASTLTETKQGPHYRLTRRLLDEPPELQVKTCGQKLAGDDHFEAMNRILRPRYERPFDLFREAPARFLLLCFPEGRYSLVINTHHTCADGVVLKSLVETILRRCHQLPIPVRTKSTPLNLSMNYRANTLSLIKDAYLRHRRPLLKHDRNPSSPSAVQPAFSSLLLDEGETGRLTGRAKQLQVTVNDLLNIAMVRTIDEIRNYPDRLMSVCVPVDLRRYLEREGCYANLTSGFYINLTRRQRADPTKLIQVFVEQRARFISQRMAFFNLILLQRMFRFLRLFPLERRRAWLDRWGYYPATFLCSNLGVVEMSPQVFENGGHRLQIRGGDILVHPNRNVDYSVIAMTYNRSLKLFFSTDRLVVPPEEAELLRGRLKDHLLGC